jgi:hypothetical protein
LPAVRPLDRRAQRVVDGARPAHAVERDGERDAPVVRAAEARERRLDRHELARDASAREGLAARREARGQRVGRWHARDRRVAPHDRALEGLERRDVAHR